MKVAVQGLNAADNMIQMLSGAGYSDKAIDYYLTRPSMGPMPAADHVSELTGECGDTMRVYLKLANDRIQDVRFEVKGCAGTVTASMAAADLVRGKRLDEAAALTDRDVLQALKTIPEEKIHCIHLAVKSLHKAIGELGASKPSGGRHAAV